MASRFGVPETVARCLGAALVVFTMLFVGAGCRRHAGTPESATFVFTSHTHGRLSPCGCFSGQFGGLARLRTGLEPDRKMVAVDVGDAIEGPEDFHEIKYKQVVHAYALMGFSALNVGQLEAGLSAARLRALAAHSEVPLVSANLLDSKTKKPLLDGWTIVRRGGLRIALVGLLDAYGMEDRLGEGLEIEPIESCLPRIVPELKTAADVLVLMAFTDEATLSAIANKYYEFPVILGGRVSQPAQDLVRTNQSLIYYTANEGKSFGSLEVFFTPGRKPQPGRYAMTLLNERFPEDDGILQLQSEFRKSIRKAKLALDDPAHSDANHVPGTRAHAQYVGSVSCLGCHRNAAEAWKNSHHAHAFEALKYADADADPTCIGCHTVGFQTPSGYRREFGSSKLTDVGCESCHGPGSTHVAQRTSWAEPTFHFRPLGAGDCMKCHQGEFSRPFQWAKFWPLMQHGKDKAVVGK